MTHEYKAFMYYAQSDLKVDGEVFYNLRQHFSSEVGVQIGKEFDVYGPDSIGWGEDKQKWIEEKINDTTFFIPILTPSFFQDDECNTASSLFLKREQQLGRTDLILPVYYIKFSGLENMPDQSEDAFIRTIAGRQLVDWRALRISLKASFTSQEVIKAIADIASRMVNVLERVRLSQQTPVSEDRPEQPEVEQNPGGMYEQQIRFSVDDYLEKQGFDDNPFVIESEAPYIPSFFIQFDWFDQLVSVRQHPQSQIVFAPSGHGKTAHRLQVARRLGERKDQPVLVVTFDMLAHLLQAAQDHVSIITYLDAIHRRVLLALRSSPERLAQCREQYNIPTHHSTLQHLFVPVYDDDDNPSHVTPSLIEACLQTPLSLIEWIRELDTLAHIAGFAGVYILVDGVDKSQWTHAQPSAIFMLLSPLLEMSIITRLHKYEFTFIFFLPQELQPYLQQSDYNWLENISDHSLVWSNALLIQMLSQRLISYSQPGQPSPTRPTGINSFQQLCDDDIDFDVDAYLVQAAQRSPGKLITMARQIVEHHCRAASSPDELISAATIKAVLQPHAGV